jgi:hypothetical protein
LFFVGEITGRRNFGKLFCRYGLTGIGVEIGTHRAAFSQLILADWPGKLLCVDPWCVPPGYEQQAAGLPQKGVDRNADYLVALHTIGQYHGRATALRATSKDASLGFGPNGVDWVYLDGDHTLIAEDMDLWWPKMRPGGILAGHDMVYPNVADGEWSRYVQPAVLAFAKEHSNLPVYLVPDSEPWSWYLCKPKEASK